MAGEAPGIAVGGVGGSRARKQLFGARETAFREGPLRGEIVQHVIVITMEKGGQWGEGRGVPAARDVVVRGVRYVFGVASSRGPPQGIPLAKQIVHGVG